MPLRALDRPPAAFYVPITALVSLAWSLTSPTLAAGPKVPEGFTVRLVASVPAVQYPCQVATAPDGSLFVAEDPMDQVGPYEAYDGRIVRFVQGTGEPRVFAEGFRAVQGMAWRDGALYVCHMPYLTVVRDTDGDGKADRKDELFHDLGPTDNRGLNDHIVSGIQFGIDGWLYISVGDKGVPGATRPEDGEKVQLRGGGTLRCRPDGRELEVYSSGTRNHLEANLDDADNLFTYDNTDDGLGWWTRVTHHIDGGYYGYPYDYHTRPDRFLPRMAEYGGGSPCGAVFYREDAWPGEYRGVGLWAEWGKGKVHAFRFQPRGATFQVGREIDFAVPDDVSNFRPIDLAVSHDGRTLYVADWNMGGWGSKTEKVGRVWAVTYTGAAAARPRGADDQPIEAQIRQLDHPSYNERIRAQAALVRKGADALAAVTTALADPSTPALARRHLIWTLDAIAGATPEATMPLVALLSDEVADLRAHAARALGQRRVPIVVEPLIALLRDRDPVVRLQAIVALRRIGDRAAAEPLLPLLADDDAYLSYAARQALRSLGDWSALEPGLRSQDRRVRAGVLLCCEQVYDVGAVALLERAATDPRHPVEERARALQYLATVHRKAKPWDGSWWGTRPAQGQPPAKVDDWEGTEVVLRTVRHGLTDPDVGMRLAAVAAVKESRDRGALPSLRGRFSSEADEEVRIEIAQSLGALADPESLPLLVAALRAEGTPEDVRDASLKAIESIGGDGAKDALVRLLNEDDLPRGRLLRVIAALGRSRAAQAVPGLLAKLDSGAAQVRGAAAEALGQVGQLDRSAAKLRAKLDDPSPSVRRNVITALGVLRDRESIPALIAAAGVEDLRYRATMALALIPDTRALHVFLRGLTDKNQDLRKASASALGAIREQAAPTLERLAERKELPLAAIPELVKIFTSLQPIRAWRVLGPFPPESNPPIDPAGPIDPTAGVPATGGKAATWKPAEAADHGEVDLTRAFSNDGELFAFGAAEVTSPGRRQAQLSVGSDDTLTVWLNGQKVYEFHDRRAFEADKDRVDVALKEGVNRVVVRCANMGGDWKFAVSVTSPTDYAFLKDARAGGFDPEAYRRYALEEQGNPRRGQALFADLKGLACAKCHAVKGQGGAVGPDLSGVGATYPRAELIASVLYPSAQIFSGYEPVVLATTDGRVLTGILKSDTTEAVEIQDAEARRIRIPRDEIDDRKTSDVSIMPSGLAEGLSKVDFADLIAYLETLRQTPQPQATR
jgi:putative membrane-bound dehydrogenase-like protein